MGLRLSKNARRGLAIATVCLLVIGAAAWSFALAACRWRFRDAALLYRDYAAAYDPNGRFDPSDPWTSGGFATCYGEAWDDTTERVIADLQRRSADRAYRRERAAHYRKLSEKYKLASEHPVWYYALDPPTYP